jgi:hypothetical protein
VARYAALTWACVGPTFPVALAAVNVYVCCALALEKLKTISIKNSELILSKKCCKDFVILICLDLI